MAKNHANWSYSTTSRNCFVILPMSNATFRMLRLAAVAGGFDSISVSTYCFCKAAVNAGFRELSVILRHFGSKGLLRRRELARGIA
jgi:hypothetical protein